VRASHERQLEALAERHFDVLCLQEVTPTTRARLDHAAIWAEVEVDAAA
jgi:endonuclease/exonuclease/phosphatase family metal-dependent hydrolase